MVGALAMLVAGLLTPLARAIALRAGLVAYPSARGVHTTPTALAGGVAVLAAFWLATGVGFETGGVEPTKSTQLLILFCGAVALLGLVDDFCALSWMVKLMAQAALVLAYTILGFGDHSAHLLVCTPLWLMLVTNAFNYIDNMNGLAALVTVIIAVCLVVLAEHAGRRDLAIAAIAAGGATLGFGLHNLRGRVFLGDTGSLMLGFCLAGIGHQLAFSGSRVAGLSVALVFSVPVLAIGLVRREITEDAQHAARW